MSADKLAQQALEHIMRCIPFGGFAQIHYGSSTWAQISEALAAHEAAPQQEPVAWVDERAIAWLEGRSNSAFITTPLQAHKSAERPMPLYAAPQQAQAPGWQLARVSDGDIRVYGPDKETWLIRKDCGEGFYDFIHRYFDAAIGAAPQGDKT